MSYYNEMYIPIFNDSLEDLSDLLYFYEGEDGFDNMLKLLNLTSEYINIDSDGNQYVIFKPVSGAVDTLRPRDLDWGCMTERRTTEIAIALSLLKICIIV